MAETVCSVLTHTKQRSASPEREIGLLIIIERCCTTKPQAAIQFIQNEAVTIIIKPIMDIFRERKKKSNEGGGASVAHYAAHIDAFSSLLVDESTMQQMMKSKTSPIPPLI